jgi:hypothetical protein
MAKNLVNSEHFLNNEEFYESDGEEIEDSKEQ